MASKRSYAYYLRGNQIAIIEEGLGSGVCSLSGYSNQTTCEAAGGTWTENATSNDDGLYRSPTATVTDGLEIEYAYSPRYFIESTDTSTTTVSGWDQDNDGNFRLRAAGGTDWTSSPNLSSVSYIVLRNAGRWNGLHKVSLVQSTRIVTTTKVSASTSNTDFEQTVTLYYDVNPLNDESDTLPISEYLSKAVVYYLKAKTAEDQGNFQLKDLLMKEFYRIVEKSDNAKIHTIRKVAPSSAAIR